MCIKLDLCKINLTLFLELSLCMYTYTPLHRAVLDLLSTFVLTLIAITKEDPNFVAGEDFE